MLPEDFESLGSMLYGKRSMKELSIKIPEELTKKIADNWEIFPKTLF